MPCLRHRQPQRRQLLRRLWSCLSWWHIQSPGAERAADAGEEADTDDDADVAAGGVAIGAVGAEGRSAINDAGA